MLIGRRRRKRIVKPQVTGDILWDAPEAAAEVELDDAGTTLLAEPEGTRVMPSRSTLLAGVLHTLCIT
jgi:hypothetical protein